MGTCTQQRREWSLFWDKKYVGSQESTQMLVCCEDPRVEPRASGNRVRVEMLLMATLTKKVLSNQKARSKKESYEGSSAETQMSLGGGKLLTGAFVPMARSQCAPLRLRIASHILLLSGRLGNPDQCSEHVRCPHFRRYGPRAPCLTGIIV